MSAVDANALALWLLVAILACQVFIAVLLLLQHGTRWEAHEVYNGVDTLLPLLARIRNDQLKMIKKLDLDDEKEESPSVGAPHQYVILLLPPFPFTAEPMAPAARADADAVDSVG